MATGGQTENWSDKYVEYQEQDHKKCQENQNIRESADELNAHSPMQAVPAQLKSALDNINKAIEVKDKHVVNMQQSGDRKHVRTINIRIPDDKTICSFFGSCLLNDGSLVVADFNNKKLKLVDPSQNKVTKYCDTDGAPQDIRCIGPQEVAVTFHKSTQVHVYNTVSLTRTGTVDLGHKTFKIACHGGLLYCAAGFPDCTILYVHDVRSGMKLREISMDTDSRKLFTFIGNIAVNSSGDRLYVADFRGLVCVGADGRQIFCLSDKDLGLYCATGLAFDHHGHVFVCGASSQNVVKVTEDGHVVGQILSKEDGVMWGPYCLSYDVGRSSLYVGGWDSDQLLMAEWK